VRTVLVQDALALTMVAAAAAAAAAVARATSTGAVSVAFDFRPDQGSKTHHHRAWIRQGLP